MYLNCIFNPPPPPPYQHRHISIRPSIHHTAAHTTPLPCTYLRNHRPTDRPTDRPNRRTSSASLSLSAAANQKNYPPSLALLALSLATPTVPNPFSILTSFSHSFASLFYPRACQRLILPSSSSSSFTSSLLHFTFSRHPPASSSSVLYLLSPQLLCGSPRPSNIFSSCRFARAPLCYAQPPRPKFAEDDIPSSIARPPVQFNLTRIADTPPTYSFRR